MYGRGTHCIASAIFLDLSAHQHLLERTTPHHRFIPCHPLVYSFTPLVMASHVMRLSRQTEPPAYPLSEYVKVSFLRFRSSRVSLPFSLRPGDPKGQDAKRSRALYYTVLYRLYQGTLKWVQKVVKRFEYTPDQQLMPSYVQYRDYLLGRAAGYTCLT
jgi:hypothetical protein